MSKNFRLRANRFAVAGLIFSGAFLGLFLGLLSRVPIGLAAPVLATPDKPLDTVTLAAAKPENQTLIRIDGAKSMLPLNRALKQQLEAQSPDLTVDVQANGTDAGLDALKQGEVDLVAIERSLTPDELAQELKTLWLDQAQLAVIVGQDNPFQGHLTVEQFQQIVRGDLTNWTQVGGPDRPIRMIDRPASSETRAILQQYGLISSDGLPAEVNRVLLKTDDTAEVIAKLGKDGIGYAIASQLTQQSKARVVKLAIPQAVLPADALYPLEQVGAIAYRPGSPAAAVAQTLSDSPDGQALLTEATQAIALDAGKSKTVAIAPGEVVPGGRDIGFLLKWVLLPLLVLGGLLKLVQVVLARQARQRNQELSAVEQVGSQGRLPAVATPASVPKAASTSAQTRILSNTEWESVTDAVVIEDESQPDIEEEPIDDVALLGTEYNREGTEPEINAAENQKEEQESESKSDVNKDYPELSSESEIADFEIAEETDLELQTISELEPKCDVEDGAIDAEIDPSDQSQSFTETPSESNLEPETECESTFTPDDTRNALVTGLALSQAPIGEPKQTLSLVELLRDEKRALEQEIETLRSRLQEADTLQDQLEAELEAARTAQSDRTSDLEELRQTLASTTQEKESYWQALSSFYAALVGESPNPGEPVDFTQLRPQIEHYQTELVTLQNQLEESRSNQEAIATDLEALNAQLRQANAERNDLTNQIVTLQRELEARHNTELITEQETQNLQVSLQEVQAEKTDLETQVSELRSQLETAQQEKDALETERNALSVELAAFRDRLDVVQQDLEAACTTHEAELTSLRSQLETLAENRAADQEIARAELADLRAQLAGKVAEQETLEAELAALQTQLSRITEEREAFAAQIAPFQTQLDSINAERDAVEADLAALRLQLLNLTAERDAFEAELTLLQLQLEESKNERNSFEAELSALRAQIAELTLEKDTAEAESDTLRTRLSEISSERDSFESELTMLQVQMDEFESGRESLEAEIDTLRGRLKDAQDHAQSAKVATEAEREATQKQLTQAVRERDAFETELLSTRAQISELNQERDQERSELAMQISELHEQLEAANSDRTALATAFETELTSLRAQLADAESTKMSLEIELNQLRPQLAENRQMFAALEQELDRLQADFSRLQQAKTADEETLETLRLQLSEAQAVPAGLQADLDEWRSRFQTLAAEVETIRQGQAEAQAQRDALQAERDGLAAQLADVRLQLEALPPSLTAEVETAGAIALITPILTSAVTAASTSGVVQAAELVAEIRRDPLRDIHGIGPIYEQKLFNAGIYTFADLAALTPEQVQDIIRPASWQQIFPAVWIEEAARLAQGVDVPADTDHDPLRDLNGIGPVYEQKLFDGGIFTFADLAAATPEQLRTLIQPESWQRFDPEAWIAEAQVISGRSPAPIPAEIPRDPLLDINGIGPVYEQKLFAAGITTFADLAAATPEQLRDIIQPESWQRFTPDAWIAEARRLIGGAEVPAQTVRDPLLDINGIGPVYEQKLFAAGIYTFADLAAATPEQLREILQPERWQRFTPDAWIAEAATLAGRSPNSHPDRDPLYEINGVGPVYEQKLFAAGITTFAALAETSEAQILEIIQPAPWQRIFPNLWIDEARGRSRQPAAAAPAEATPATEATTEPPAASQPPADAPASSLVPKPTPTRKKPPSKRGKRR
jgi:predicted flap endonuclease-1-like 5' DNA nuclease/ABC-type phosphate transport system substrate-binding protein/DNA repair exonuclease SbcCD ATPase subunit